MPKTQERKVPDQSSWVTWSIPGPVGRGHGVQTPMADLGLPLQPSVWVFTEQKRLAESLKCSFSLTLRTCSFLALKDYVHVGQHQILGVVVLQVAVYHLGVG